jgi:peptidoglycan/LPS O-acetylase OafA/YrhL
MNVSPLLAPLSPRPWPAMIASVVLGALIGLVLWSQSPHNDLDLPPWPIAASGAALVLGCLFPAGAWRWALLLTGGLAGGALLGMVPGFIKDPTSNNLWPIVLVILMGVCVLPALAGVYLGALLRKLLQRTRP